MDQSFPGDVRRYDIRPLTAKDIPVYADVIRKSFMTVADRLGITRENFATFTAFSADESFAAKHTDGYYPFGLYVGGILIGFVSLTDCGDGRFDLNNLAVLPDRRRFGYGRILLDFCKDKAIMLGGSKITLGMIRENTVLGKWYEANGFVRTVTTKFPWQPITVDFREWSVK